MNTKMKPEIIELRDGTSVVICPIEANDVPRLMAMHERVSEHCRFLRYLGAVNPLSLDEVREMCENDYQTHMGLVVAPLSTPDEVVGVAFYVEDDSAPDAAEIAILVEDSWQGHGLGTLLLERLTPYAIAHGIKVFTAYVHWENDQIWRFIKQSGLPCTKVLEQGICEIRITLPSEKEMSHLHFNVREPLLTH